MLAFDNQRRSSMANQLYTLIVVAAHTALDLSSSAHQILALEGASPAP